MWVVILVMSFCLNSCNRIPEDQIQTGDLLFTALPLDYTLKDSVDGKPYVKQPIKEGEEVNYIHVSILEVDKNDSIWVIDATIKHNVGRYPLSEFLRDFTLKDGSYPRFEVMRLKNNRHADAFVEKAKKLVGRSYDFDFLNNNQDIYCSELVRFAYVWKRDTLFAEGPISFKSSDGTTPTYWTELFEKIEKPIPEGNMGILPNKMIGDPCLKRVKVLDNPDNLLK